MTRILCKKISQIEQSVVEIFGAPFFTHVSIKSRITGEKLKSVKNGKNLIIHISHKEHNAKRISSIAFIFQKIVELGGTTLMFVGCEISYGTYNNWNGFKHVIYFVSVHFLTL